MLDLEECVSFVLTFSLYIEEDRDDRYVTFFRFGNFALNGNFTLTNPGFAEGEVRWESDVRLCIKQFTLSLKAWSYFSVRVASHRLKSVTINGLDFSSGVICEDVSTALSSNAELSFGNVSKICVDEIFLEKWQVKTEDLKKIYYDVLSKLDLGNAFSLSLW